MTENSGANAVEKKYENFVFLGVAVRENAGRTVFVVLLLLLAGLAEAIGIATLLPIISVATRGVIGDSALEEIVRAGLGTVHLAPTLGVLLVIFVLGIVLKSATIFFAMLHVGYTVARISTDLRLNLMRSVMSANWVYFVNRKVGTFSNAITTESTRSGQLYSSAFKMVAGALQATVYLCLTSFVSWRFTVGAIVVSVIMFMSLRFLVTMAGRAGHAQAVHFEIMVSRLTDALAGIKPLKAMAWQNRLLPLLETQAEKVNAGMRKQVLSVELMKGAHEPLTAFFLAGAIFFALAVAGFEAEATFAMGIYFYRAVNLAGLVQKTYQGMTANMRFYANMQAKIDDAQAAAERITGGDAPIFSDRIELNSVRFSYGDKTVLSGLSMEIPFGQITALRGGSGSGKTTAADLIIGLMRPNDGDIQIDGVPLSSINLRQWRRQIGYVPQELSLLHDTILTNITLSDPAYSRQDAERALRSAGAWDFVSSLPQGLGTIAGERGAAMSGGQRQRIAIARALVRRPRLLILDEATTALDPVTEASICETIKGLALETAVLAISHQAALTDISDRVYTLSDGVAVLGERNAAGPPLAAAESLT